MDYFVATLLIVLCGMFLYESWDLPPGSFEPLGSGPIPQAVSVLIMGMCVCVMFNAWRRDKAAVAETAEIAEEDRPEPPRPRNAVIVLVATVLYALAMAYQLLPFWLATIILVFSIIAILSGFNRRSMVIGLIIATVMGVGCQIIFTQIFFVDLPGT